MPRKKKCRYCGVLFIVHPRLKQRQVTCGKEECKRAHKKFLNGGRKAKAFEKSQCSGLEIQQQVSGQKK